MVETMAKQTVGPSQPARPADPARHSGRHPGAAVEAGRQFKYGQPVAGGSRGIDVDFRLSPSKKETI